MNTLVDQSPAQENRGGSDLVRRAVSAVAAVPGRAPRWARYTVALLAVPVAALLQAAVVPFVGSDVSYLALFPVTVAVAVIGGVYAAVVTGVLGAVVVDYLFLPPPYTLDFGSAAIIRIGFVALTSVFVGSVAEVLRTARSEAERRARELANSEQRMAYALEASQIGAWNLDLKSLTAERSIEHDRIFGYDHLLPSWTLEQFLDHVLPEDRGSVEREFHEAVAQGKDWCFECRIRRADGAVRWIWVAGRHHTDPKDALHLAGIVQDITDRKMNQHALETLNAELQERVAEQTIEIRKGYELMKAERGRFYAVLETMPAYVCLLTTDYRIAFANREFRERFGEPTAEPCYRQLFGRDVPCEICNTYKVLSEGQVQRWEWSGPDGNVYDIYDCPFIDSDGSPLIMEVGMEVTGLKKAQAELLATKETLERRVEERTAELAERERSLQRTHELLEAVTEGTDELIIAQDTEFRYIFLNNVARQELERLTGKTVRLGMSMPELFAHLPVERHIALDQWGRAIGGETIRETLEYGEPSRHRRIYQIRLAPIRDASGHIIGAGQTATDVTDQAQAEEDHRQTRDYLENLFSHANAPIIVWDSELRVVRFNHAFEQLTGRSAGDVLGRRLELLFPADSRAEAMAHIRRAVAGERWEVVEIDVLHLDGSVRTLIWNSAPLFAADGRTVLATIAQGQDITERKAAEEALTQARDELEQRVAERTAELDRTVEALTASSEQLRALASALTVAEQRERQRLAMVLHDDLQQLLVAALIQSVPLQKSDIPDVREQAMHLSDVVRQTLDTSRSLTAELTAPVLQHGGLAGGLRWLAEWMHERHELDIDLTIDERAAPQDEVASDVLFRSVRELLLNVVKHSQVKHASVDVALADGQVVITVRDSGVGFDPSQVHHPEKASLGLGLATAQERLGQLGGRMDIRSAPGRGSCFTLAVPTERPGSAPGPSAQRKKPGAVPA